MNKFIIKDKRNGKIINNAAVHLKNQILSKFISMKRKCHRIAVISLDSDLQLPLEKKTQTRSKIQVNTCKDYN